MTKKYELSTETKTVYGHKLYRIRALKDFGKVKAGYLGGWIESEKNLSQANTAWVYNDAKIFGNALVYGNAQVYGDALVSGDAQVYGNAKVTTEIINLVGLDFTITISDKHLSAGCEIATFKEWKGKKGLAIAKKHNELKFLKVIRALLKTLNK
jgi:hypothetical protein